MSEVRPLPRTRRGRWGLVALYLGLAALVYATSLGGDWVYDDHRFIVTNEALELGNVVRFFHDPTVVDPEGNWEGIYRPLRSLSFAVDRFFFGRNPVGYRIHALLAHVLAALALGMLLTRLTRRFGPGTPPWLGHALGLVFAVHPVHVESVAWVTSRSDVEAGLFVFLALLALVRAGGHVPGALRPGIVPGIVPGVVPGVVLGVVAFFAKESSVMLPMIGLVLAALVRRPGAPIAWRRWVVLLVLAVGFFLVRDAVLGAYAVQRDEATEAWPMRYPTMAIGFGWYVCRLLAPIGFRFDYQLDPWPDVFLDETAGVVFLAVIIAVAIAILVLVVRARRSAIARSALAGIVWSFLAILPMSNLLISINILVAERFLYVAAGGFLLAFGAIVTLFLDRRRARTIVGAVFVGWALLLGMTTWTFASVWRTERSLWEAVRAHSPAHYRPYQGLAKSHVQAGEYDAARRLLREAITRCGGAHPEIWFDLGRTFLAEGNPAKAAPPLRRAVDLWRARRVGAKDLRYRRTLMYLADYYGRVGDEPARATMGAWLAEAGGPLPPVTRG